MAIFARLLIFMLLCLTQLPCKQLKITPKSDTKLRFVFIVPSYNNARWYDKNMLSMLSQEYENFHIIYIDDASTDNTANLVEALIKEKNASDKVTLIKNTTRQGIMANRYKAIQLCNDNDICLALDGDDWVPHAKILNLYNKIYQNRDIWLTYGNYIEYPSGKKNCCTRKIPKRILTNQAIRKYPWCCSHLKTFRAWLFKLIKVEDLMMGDSFIPLATDLAIMFPMVEMAKYHTKFVREISYVYNHPRYRLGVVNQQNKIRSECSKFLRSKKPYDALTEAPH